MMWQRRISYGTTVSTHKIVRFPSVSEQTFIRVMRQEVMPAIPAVNTGAIFIGWQELIKDETHSPLGGDTYLWRLHWHGFHRPVLVRKESERLFEQVRDKVFTVGIHTALTIATPFQERWVLREGQWVAQ